MTADKSSGNSPERAASILAMVNVGIWAISIIALAFVIRHSPGAKGLFPILGGGVAVGIALISVVSKPRDSKAG